MRFRWLYLAAATVLVAVGVIELLAALGLPVPLVGLILLPPIVFATLAAGQVGGWGALALVLAYSAYFFTARAGFAAPGLAGVLAEVALIGGATVVATDRLAALGRQAAARTESLTALRRVDDLLQGLDALVYEADVNDRTLTFVNQSFEALLGFGRQQWLGGGLDFFIQRVHTEDRERVRRVWDELGRGGRGRRIDYRMISSQGRVVYLQEQTRAVCDAQGRPRSIWGVAVDLTSQRALAQRLDESQTRLRAVLDHVSDYILLYPIKSDGRPQRLLDVNEAAVRALEYPRQRLLQMTVLDLLDDSLDLATQTQAYTGQTEGLIESIHVTGKGRRVPVEVRAHLFEMDGQPTVLAACRDISDRKQAREVFETHRVRLRALFHQANDPILVYQLSDDSFGRIIDANQAAQEVLGYSRRELLSMTNTDLMDDPTADEDKAKQLRREGRLLTESVYVAKDGRRIPMEVNVHLFKLQNKPTALSVGRDITLRKQAECALREAAENYELMFQSTGDAILLFPLNDDDTPGKITQANDAAVQLLGYTREQLLSMTPWEAFSFGPGFQSRLPQLREKQTVQTEYDLTTRRDRRLNLEVNLHLIHLKGRPTVMAVGRDITQRKQVAEALAHEHELTEIERRRLSTVLDVMPVPVFIADRDGKLIHINAAARSLWGDRPLPQSIEQYHTYRAWWPETGRELESHEWALARALRDGQVVTEQELEIESPGGERRTILNYARPILDDADVILGGVAVNVDITPRKRMIEQLKSLNETLEQRVRQRTHVAEHRAAQLRALAAELTQTEQRERRRLAQTLHDHLQQLLVAAKLRASVAIGDCRDGQSSSVLHEVVSLLDDAIADSRSLTVQLSPPILYDAGLAAALEWLARYMREKHELRVDVEADPAANPTQEALAALFFESARELLFNIVKHAQTDQAQLTLAVAEEDMRLVVEDAGRGLDPATLDRAETDGVEGGFGLLSIRERLELLGGRMQIDSAPGQGTRVTLLAPRGAAAPPPAAPIRRGEPAPAQAAAPPEPTADGAVRILLADDHKILREGLARLLGEEPDFEIVGQASDGLMAIDMARQTHPEVVVMDVGMPTMNGIEATRQLKQEMPGVRVVGLSMHGEADMAAAMRSAGADAYLTKGGPAETLVATIRGLHADRSA